MDGNVTGDGVVVKEVWNLDKGVDVWNLEDGFEVWNLEDDVEVWNLENGVDVFNLDDGAGVVVKAVWNLSLELTVTGTGGTAVLTSNWFGILLLTAGAVFLNPNLGCC